MSWRYDSSPLASSPLHPIKRTIIPSLRSSFLWKMRVNKRINRRPCLVACGVPDTHLPSIPVLRKRIPNMTPALLNRQRASSPPMKEGLGGCRFADELAIGAAWLTRSEIKSSRAYQSPSSTFSGISRGRGLHISRGKRARASISCAEWISECPPYGGAGNLSRQWIITRRRIVIR